MNIFETLNEIKDLRHEGELCEFNGYLEDYLNQTSEEDKEHQILKTLFELNNDLKVVHNLKVSLSKTSISNQIIRYKDINKIGEYPLCIKYIVYGKENDVAKAIIFDEEFIYAKGLYYVLSEEPSPFNALRNDIIVLSLNDEIEDIKSFYSELFKTKTSSLQRRIDQKHLNNWEDTLEKVLKLGSDLEVSSKEEVLNDRKNRNNIINGAISKWYLLKKFTYVQYMVNKDILNTVHEGNIKAQRNQAKINSDKIRFVPLSSLWRLNDENKEENKEEVS